jgi:hypothetical protein
MLYLQCTVPSWVIIKKICKDAIRCTEKVDSIYILWWTDIRSGNAMA